MDVIIKRRQIVETSLDTSYWGDRWKRSLQEVARLCIVLISLNPDTRTLFDQVLSTLKRILADSTGVPKPSRYSSVRLTLVTLRGCRL